jgi:23S rRNA A1618 N6-methylase RlmF
VSRSIAILVLSAVALFAAANAPAAEAPTRDEYVDQLEQVCKPDALATQRAMRGARGDIRAERLTVAAKKFGKATAIFGGTVKEISAVPRPSADSAKLGKWFTYLKRQESYLKQITEQLRQGHAIKAQRLTARFIHNGNLANNVVLAFGFHWCGFEFSRYG